MSTDPSATFAAPSRLADGLAGASRVWVRPPGAAARTTAAGGDPHAPPEVSLRRSATASVAWSLDPRVEGAESVILADPGFSAVARPLLADALVALRDAAPTGIVCAWSNCPGWPVATLLPPAVWERVLEAAGWTVEDRVPERRASTGEWADRWRAADPFRAAGCDRTWWRVRVAERCPVTDVRERLRPLVGPQWGGRHGLPGTAFLLATPQDYHALFPWLVAVGDAGAAVYLRRIPEAEVAARRQAEVVLACRAIGLEPRIVSTPRDMAAAPEAFDLLMCAAESSASVQHLSSAAMLLAARARGAATAHVQHGVWPRAEFPAPVATYADLILAWSEEYGEALGAPSRPLTVTGCPRFDRYADPARCSAQAIYGPWAGRYGRHVLVTTNLHWLQHQVRLDAAELLAALAARWPHTLFTLRPHPFESSEAISGALPDNVIVADETLLLAAGLDPGDLVEAADAVVTTPSTVALEAALAGRPCFVLDTGNPNTYDLLPSHDLTALDRWLAAPATAATSGAFAARYHDPSALGRSWELGQRALDALCRRRAAAPLPPELAAAFADAWARHARILEETAAELRRHVAVKDEYIASLRWTLDRKDEIIATLHGRLAAARTAAPGSEP